MGVTISWNIGALKSSKNAKISTQCYDKEEMKFVNLLGKFQDVFFWSYEDLRSFDPGLMQHAILIKGGIKLVRQKQRHINPIPKAIIRKGLGKIMKVGIILPVKCSGQVSNLVPI